MAAATTRGTGSARGARGAGRGRGRGKGTGRPTRKTAEELDAEMTDYFGNGTAAAPDGATAATNGASAPAATAGDDLGMDEISVGAPAWNKCPACNEVRLTMYCQ